MKKFILGAAMAVIAATGITAQAQNSVFESDDNTMIVRPIISLDVTCPTDVSLIDGLLKSNLLDPGAGLSFGADLQIPLWKNLYLRPGAQFYYHTAKFSKEILNQMEAEDGLTPVSGSVREFGLSIPIVVGYHFDLDPVKLHFFTGPEFNIGFSGKVHAGYRSNGVKLNSSESMYDELRRGDVAWVVGAGVEYDRFYVSLSAKPGMVNWVKDDIIYGTSANENYKLKMKKTNVSIAVGYNFSL